MSIIWCGGEDIDFNGVTPVAQSTTTASRRVDYARVSLYGTGIRTNRFTPQTEMWFSVQVYMDDDTALSNGFIFRSPEGNNVISIGSGVGSFNFAIKANNVILAESASSTISQGALMKLDVYIDYAVSGTVILYKDGAEVLSYSGDVTGSGATEMDSVHLYNLGGGLSDNTYYSELIVADEDTRLMSLKTLVPNAAGDASDWTNDYTSIDESNVEDAGTIFTETTGDEFQCNLTGMPTGDFICKGVMIRARATDGVGGLGVAMGIKTNSTLDYGDDITLGGVWETIEELYQQNPVTTNRFTPAEIDALQFAVKAVTV